MVLLKSGKMQSVGPHWRAWVTGDVLCFAIASFPAFLDSVSLILICLKRGAICSNYHNVLPKFEGPKKTGIELSETMTKIK